MRAWSAAAVTAISLCALPCRGVPVDNCRALRHHGKLEQAQACFCGLLRDSDPLVQRRRLFGSAAIRRSQ